MDERRTVRISKYLARHLRNRPQDIQITLDPHGWVDVDELLSAAARHGFPISRDELDHVVAVNDKRRYAFDETGRRIRANQGHSVDVDLDLPVTPPPPYLYHGTTSRFVAAIRREGLRRMNRHAVHLSPDRRTAERVGSRRGTPVVLTVDSGRMAADGHQFRVTPNNVWLVESVPPRYLRFGG
ncbi:putative RNA 2'-phosphotransferase [Actinomadura sp. NBRC 104425]|uniref:RNA 2'-phosphotransferase n=1 Tax=Actinomadura sp. NBRC 104425 TaxID=3032204 RepID=UPI0024A3CB1D|nr:RNA 2'-phosphotransferase [Actinomadura sp. NBRC 104425]GLZ11058.1 putative RNA 2'-phosphotransferase [Actinomadura sp. NBRC 104425]